MTPEQLRERIQNAKPDDLRAEIQVGWYIAGFLKNAADAMMITSHRAGDVIGLERAEILRQAAIILATGLPNLGDDPAVLLEQLQAETKPLEVA